MRHHLDCVLLHTRPGWADDLLAATPACERLQLHALLAPPAPHPDQDYLFLRRSSALLLRFDACLIPIEEATLASTRRALSAAQASLPIPVFGLVRHIKAAALLDLLQLGLADYVREPLCLEDLRARINRHRLYAGPPGVTEPRQPGRLHYRVQECQDLVLHPGPTEQRLSQTILQQEGTTLDAYAAAVASRYACSQESFKEAKGRIVARFEQAYIHAALDRHSGNIAMAARSAQKHRRAFWALMRKHHIDASRFRSASNPNEEHDG
ncbi:hypothetical protein [Alcaligenes sp. WGS1538]|uniref:hypothetical protein n=1 Tax=Alcaligenes sp. WGS1538 TaxID=3366811 RepID=UPI00372D6D91